MISADGSRTQCQERHKVQKTPSLPAFMHQTQGQVGREGWGGSLLVGESTEEPVFLRMLLDLGRVEGHSHLLPRTAIPITAELVVEARSSPTALLIRLWDERGRTNNRAFCFPVQPNNLKNVDQCTFHSPSIDRAHPIWTEFQRP